MDELKPCPFCGGTDIETGYHHPQYRGDVDAWNVGCPSCGVWFDWLFNTEAEAIESWNRRAKKEDDD